MPRLPEERRSLTAGAGRPFEEARQVGTRQIQVVLGGLDPARTGGRASFATYLRRSAPAWRPVVKRRSGRSPESSWPILSLDVMTQDLNRGSANRSSEVRARPQPLGTPVVPGNLGELLAHPPGRNSLEVVDKLRQGGLGWEVTQQADVVGLSVELDRLALEAFAYRPEHLLQPHQVAAPKTWWRCLVTEPSERGAEMHSACQYGRPRRVS